MTAVQPIAAVRTADVRSDRWLALYGLCGALAALRDRRAADLLALFASKWFVIGYPISIALAIAAWQAQTTTE